MNQQDKKDLWEVLKTLGENGLVMNHYELEAKTKIPNEVWKDFLNEPEVSDWIRSEISILRKAELNKMVKGVSDSRSVGQAQLMTTLQKLDEKSTSKEGPIFVYCYIPLSYEQAQAENIQILDHDPFLKE